MNIFKGAVDTGGGDISTNPICIKGSKASQFTFGKNFTLDGVEWTQNINANHHRRESYVELQSYLIFAWTMSFGSCFNEGNMTHMSDDKTNHCNNEKNVSNESMGNDSNENEIDDFSMSDDDEEDKLSPSAGRKDTTKQGKNNNINKRKNRGIMYENEDENSCQDRGLFSRSYENENGRNTFDKQVDRHGQIDAINCCDCGNKFIYATVSEIYESKFDTNYGIDCCGNNCDNTIGYNEHFYHCKNRCTDLCKKCIKQNQSYIIDISNWNNSNGNNDQNKNFNHSGPPQVTNLIATNIYFNIDNTRVKFYLCCHNEK